jgi:hypothetical protein
VLNDTLNSLDVDCLSVLTEVYKQLTDGLIAALLFGFLLFLMDFGGIFSCFTLSVIFPIAVGPAVAQFSKFAAV